jgi:hypothetical protein
VLQNILLEAKGRSQPVSSYTHLPRRQEIALVFSMVHSFCTQTNPSQKFHFPIPFHFISCWRISILMLSFFHPRKEDQKPKISQTLWEANIACEFQGSSLIVVMTLERFHHSSYYFPEGQLLFQMHDDTNTVEDYQIVYKLTNKTMWQNLSWVSIMSHNRHLSNSPLASLGSHNGHHLIHIQSISVLIHSNALFFFLVFSLKFVIWNIWSFFPKS